MAELIKEAEMRTKQASQMISCALALAVVFAAALLANLAKR